MLICLCFVFNFIVIIIRTIVVLRTCLEQKKKWKLKKEEFLEARALAKENKLQEAEKPKEKVTDTLAPGTHEAMIPDNLAAILSPEEVLALSLKDQDKEIYVEEKYDRDHVYND